MDASKVSHRSRSSSAFLFPESADYHHEPGPSSTASPRLQILSGTGSPCGEGSWISLSAKELLEEEYSEVEYSDLDGEDDMIFDSPPYYHYGDEHLQHHLQHQMQQNRPLAFAGKSSGLDFPTLPLPNHQSQEQEQAEEALRASLSTLLATGPRPRFRQRQHRPRKIYTVDSRSQRSSPRVPASPTHMYYSSAGSPHLRPSNPDSILGDLSPHYFHGSITPNSRDYDSASSDSEQNRQKQAYHRGILATGDTSYTRPALDHYYEIESSTLNSNDPPYSPYSGTTTPHTPPRSHTTLGAQDSIADKVSHSPVSLLTARYVSWSVKAQSILDHAYRTPCTKYADGSSCGTNSAPSSSTSSAHSSPSSSGASTPSRIRRKRVPIPQPHQGFYSRALDQRSLASHVSISRVGMGGAICPPLHLGLHTGTLIRGSSPLRPAASHSSSTSQQSFRSKQEGLSIHQHGDERADPMSSADDKENKRWYGQEIGLNLWQTTLGAAALLGTGFGTGMVKKVHLQSAQPPGKEASP